MQPPEQKDMLVVESKADVEVSTAAPTLWHLYCPACYPDGSPHATSLCRALTRALPRPEPSEERPPCKVCAELSQMACERCGFTPW